MTIQLKITLFGGVAFAVDGSLIDALPTRTEQALLIYLCYQPRPIPRDVLINLFYPESDADQGRRNLRTALSRIKAKIGDVLDAGRAAVGLRADLDLWRDTVWFEQALENSESGISAEILQSTLDNYYGDFLAGFFLRNAPEFELWQVGVRERLRLLAVQGFERLIKMLIAAADYQTALTYTNKLLTIEPLMEHIHRSKMLLLARLGQPAQALRHFQEAQGLLADELGITLSQSTRDLRERIANLETPPPFVIPEPRSRFVGRKDELAQLVALLQQPEQRLITLFGTGGMGKTRLALQLARALYRAHNGLFLDGIYFVDLSTVHSAETLIQQLAASMGLMLKGQDELARLLSVLAKRERLLILDNFEQLASNPAAVDVIDQLLQQVPSLKLLVTSREQIQLYEETVFEVGGMAVPSSDETDISQVESVDLFMTQARRRQRNYKAEGAALEAIAALCRLVVGSPLAVELAAGLMQERTPVQLLESIRNSLGLLSSDLHNVPDRQRSLRAVFAHSWDLLSLPLQTALARLAVFPTHFDAAAAYAIASVGDAQLAALKTMSLLQFDSAMGRFAIHPLLREFSAEKTPDLPTLRQSYASYYLNWLPSQEHAFNTSAATNIAHEKDNLRLAWQIAVDSGAEIAAPLLGATSLVTRYWIAQGWLHEGNTMLRAAHEMLINANHPAQDTLISYRGAILRNLSRFDEAAALVEPYLDGNIPPSAERALGKGVLGMCHAFTSRTQEAADLLTAAAREFEAMGNFNLQAHYLSLASLVWSRSGDLDKSEAFFSEALALPTQARYRCTNLNHYGMSRIGRGQYDVAREMLQASLDQMRAIDYRAGLASATVNFSVAALYSRHYDVCHAAASEALTYFEQQQELHGMAVALNTLGLVHLEQQDYANALPYFDRALTINRPLKNQVGLMLTLTQMAHAQAGVSRTDKEKEGAFALLVEAFEELYVFSDNPYNTTLPRVARTLALLGEVELAALTAAHVAIRRPIEMYYQSDAVALLQELNATESLIERGEALSRDDIRQSIQAAYRNRTPQGTH